MSNQPSGGSSIYRTHLSKHDEVRAGAKFGAWINGETHTTDDSIAVYDPVIDEQMLTVPDCTAAEVDAAVTAAWDAFDRTWESTVPRDRSSLLFEWADALEKHFEELTLLECLDCGKPISQARGEIEGAIDTLEYYASVCRAQRGSEAPAATDLHLYMKHEPYGVGQVVPWNYPLWAAAWKLGPASAAGNACVLKPSSETPLSMVRAAQLSADIFPDGVVNIIMGSGSIAGRSLAEHDDVRKVSFTGSTAVGSSVMQAAVDRVAPVTLELGGKSPFIMFPDADLDKVVDAVADGIFYSTGEICDALSRALVHESIVDEFTERFVEKAESYVLGNPLNEATTMVPLTSEDQFQTVTDYIETGREEATLLCGGAWPDGPALADGWYIEPIVFGDVSNDMTIAQQEIFGPV
jgi:aldehyde dehydrogenase (NAD+)